MSATTATTSETQPVVAADFVDRLAATAVGSLPAAAPGAVITGTEGNDQGNFSLIGSVNDDTIVGLGGDDFIDGDAGDDQISVRAAGGYGDTVHGGSGTDALAVQLDVAGGIFFANQLPVRDSNLVTYNSSLTDVLVMKNGGNYKLGIGNYGYAGVNFDGIESLSIQAFNADQQDLLVAFGQGSYDGGAGIDTFFADWSAAGWPVVWNNLAAGAQDVNGSSVGNVERLLLRTGSGDDDLRNAVAVSNDTFETGDGSDTVHAGDGDDLIDTQAGDDQISVLATAGYGDTVHGGTGTDALAVQVDVAGGIFFANQLPVRDSNHVNYNSSLADVLVMKAGGNYKLGIGNYAYAGVNFDGIENLGIQAFGADQQDLLVVFGHGNYDGAAGTDTLFADWSAATADIAWNNPADGTVQSVNGSSISNVERLLVRTGSGNDDLRNLAAGTNDEFETGAGHDRVYAGAGNDRILGGSGNDTIDGGAGTDTAVFAGARALYTVTRNAAGTSFVVTSAAEGSDWLSLVENFQFADGTVAASTFTTEDTTAPSVVSVNPADEATGVPTTTDIVGTFDEAIQRGSGFITLKNAAGATVESFDAASSARLSIVGSTLSVDPSAQLASMTGYRLEFAAGSIKDLLGNGIALIDSYNFTTGAASYTGTAGNDVLTGDDYANTFTGLAGDDAISGLGGTDTAVYTGARADYAISVAGAVRLVNDSLPGRDGNDSLSSIERLRFADAAVAYDMDGNAGTVAKLVGAVFGASALHDAALVGSYLSLLDNGASAQEVAALALASARFAQLAGSHGNVDFVNTVYENVAGVAPGTAERDELVSLLDSGAVTQATLALLAAEHPLNQARIDLAGLAATGLGYGAAAAGTVQFGTSGPDVLTGTSAADQLYGLAGNDTLGGGSGNDSLEGGEGIDRAVFDGDSGHFGWSREDSGWSVMDARGPYTIDLVGIERLQFEDRHVALDIDGAAGMTAKLLGAVFGASFVANPEFVGIGLSVFDAGMTYEQVAQLALDARLGAAHTHQQAVELMYTNLIGLPPSPQDSAELVALIDVYHLFTEASLAVFAAELPYNTDNIDLVGLSQTGIEFVPA